jgi:hypothetical protein
MGLWPEDQPIKQFSVEAKKQRGRRLRATGLDCPPGIAWQAREDASKACFDEPRSHRSDRRYHLRRRACELFATSG